MRISTQYITLYRIMPKIANRSCKSWFERPYIAYPWAHSLDTRLPAMPIKVQRQRESEGRLLSLLLLQSRNKSRWINNFHSINKRDNILSQRKQNLYRFVRPGNEELLWTAAIIQSLTTVSLPSGKLTIWR